MMLSVGKIFWLIIILIAVWYLFKIIEKRKLNTVNNSQNKDNNDNINKNGIDAFKCDVCGLWSTGKKCNNKECANS